MGKILLWATRRGEYHITRDRLSAFGLISDEIAAAFVYKDPSASIAYIDNLVTDPDSSPIGSARAMRSLFPALFGAAGGLGAERTIAFTRHGPIAKLCYKQMRPGQAVGYLMCKDN